MIEGAVNAVYEAVVTLPLQRPEGRTRGIQYAIDTGYAGNLTLPTAVVADLRLSFSHIGWAFLANDDVASFDLRGVIVLWHGQPRHIKAEATGSIPLVGMRLLDRHNLNIEVESGGRVVTQARAKPNATETRLRLRVAVQYIDRFGQIANGRRHAGGSRQPERPVVNAGPSVDDGRRLRSDPKHSLLVPMDASRPSLLW